MNSVISERGQITIPKRLRDRLGLRTGQRIEFEVRSGLLIGRKKARDADPVLEVTGILPPLDVDGALEKSRGPRWRKDLDENGR